jgi:arginase family enzyme
MVSFDHSVTFESLKAVDEGQSKFSLVYLDAHPDAVPTLPHYYGSVIYDASKLTNIDMKSSYIIGVRAWDQEEVAIVDEIGINLVTPAEIIEEGMKNMCRRVSDNLTGNVYLSIDIDCIDPTFEP